MRYLIWPRLSFCCACCTAAAGCGIVTPTWMRDSNGTFVGTSNLTTPAWTGLADQWEITGLQPNVWATEAGTTIPVYFGQVSLRWPGDSARPRCEAGAFVCPNVNGQLRRDVLTSLV